MSFLIIPILAAEAAPIYEYFYNQTNGTGNQTGGELPGGTEGTEGNLAILGEGENPPNVTLISPDDNTTTTNTSITFFANVSSGINLTNASLYTNISGSWELNDTQYYGNIQPDSTTVGLWHFDEGIGTTAADSSGQGNDGTLQGGLDITGWTTDSKLGTYALDFDGTDDYVSLSSQPNLTSGFTFSAWVKREGDNPAGLELIFYNNQFFLRTQPEWENPGRPFEAFITLSDYSVEPRANSGVASTLGQWFFVTVTWDKTNLSIYVNGELKGTSTRTGDLIDAPGESYIGTYAGNYYFNGTIDEVAIYNRSLSEDEIKALYQRKNYATSDFVNWTLSNILAGTYNWNVQAFDSAGQSSWGDENYTLTIEEPDCPANMSGNNTTEEPCLITTCEQLQAMNESLAYYYALNKSIDCINTSISGSIWTDGKGFNPIGDDVNAFTGSLDGRNYKITNLSINRPSEDYVGLFGYTGPGSNITNIGLENVSVLGNIYVGGLAGYNYGPINSSYSTGDVSGSDTVGGLAGYNDGPINSSYSTGSVSGSSNTVGGLVGNNDALITSSYSTGSVSGNQYIGGLIGLNSFSITSSYATGNVLGNTQVGGLVGSNYNPITSSYSTGSVLGDGLVGGLAGENYNSITSSYSTGNVLGSNYVGGLAGANFGPITSSYSRGSVTGTASGVGGLVGVNWGGSITSSNSTGDVSGNTEVGGLVGENYGPITSSYSRGNVLGNSNVGGLVGYNTGGSITSSNSTGSVTGTGDNTGGLVGYNDGGPINSSYSTGDVLGVNSVGGLAGYNPSGTITSSYATGSVSGNSFVGGLVGQNSGPITSSYATGSVSGGYSVGGLAGYNDGPITSSYSTGDVLGVNSVGGLAGINAGSITSSYATGSVSGVDDVGGLVGDNYGSITSSYSTGSVNGSDTVGGFIGYNDGSGTYPDCGWYDQNDSTPAIGNDTTALPPGPILEITYNETAPSAFFDTKNTHPIYSSWDFDTVWDDVCNGTRYPPLQWQNASADYYCLGLFCGDETCTDSYENSISCPQDCEAPPDYYHYNECGKDWDCTAWSSCSGGTQTRSCTCGCANDNDCLGDHTTERSCGCATTSDCAPQACKVASCNGQCVYSNAPAGTSCDDGNACTINDYCSNGICTGNFICECKSDSDCGDGNPCTSESCVSGHCQHAQVSGSCSDNDNCTENDYCSNGLCMPGKNICEKPSPILFKDIGTQISEALQSVVTFIGDPITLILLPCTIVGVLGGFLYWRRRREGRHTQKL